MKGLILTLMLTSTVSYASNASEFFKICNKGNESYRGTGASKYFGGNKLKVVELSALPNKARSSSKIICGSLHDGDLLFINKTNKSYAINFNEECSELLTSMEENPNVVYEVEVIDGNVVHVVKTDSTDCTVKGSTILDI